jgi:acyl-CoA thioester hydrolase
MSVETSSGAIVGGVHVYPLRVYFEDTDTAGVVYYANYLKYAERARTEMLRTLGVPHAAMMAGDGLTFAVRRCEADYLRPAHLDDALEVHTSGIALEAASLWADQVVMRRDETLVRMRLRLACLGEGGRPARLPPALRTALRPLLRHGGQGGFAERYGIRNRTHAWNQTP